MQQFLKEYIVSFQNYHETFSNFHMGHYEVICP